MKKRTKTHTEMKQLTEVKDGQKVLVALTVKTTKDKLYPIELYGTYKDEYFATLTSDLREIYSNPPEEIYDFEEVMNLSEKSTSSKSEPISKEEFDKKIDEIVFHLNHRDKWNDAFYKLFQSFHPESFTPEVNKEYEFSDNGINWYRYKLHSFYTLDKNMIYGNFYYIRPIQQSEEELKAIELLKNLGYKIEK